MKRFTPAEMAKMKETLYMDLARVVDRDAHEIIYFPLPTKIRLPESVLVPLDAAHETCRLDGCHPVRIWAIWREMATRFPFSSHTSPSASSNPQVTKRVLREQLSHRDLGKFRMFTVNSMVGTQATIPCEARIPGGRESATRRIEAMSYGWSSRSRIQPRVSDRSDRWFSSHPAHAGSRRSSTWRKRL